MRRINSISKQSLQLFLGIFVGLFLLTQTDVIVVDSNVDQQEQTESEEQGDQDQLSISEAVPSSGSQINLGFHSFLMQELVQHEEEDDQQSLEETIFGSTQKALKVLFRRIISVNAP